MADKEAAAPEKVERKVKIISSDVPKDKTDNIIARINEAMSKYQLEKDVATFVKKKCDEEYGGTWHCVAGRNFGCSITHDTKFVLFLKVDQLHVLLFKSFE